MSTATLTAPTTNIAALSEAIQAKFGTFRTELNKAMIERHLEIDLGLTAIACGEHVVFVGPPGVGKSMLCDAFIQWMHGKGFSYLLNKFTNPEELVGPLDIAALKNSVYKRLTTNTIIDADFCFIDEVFKGSSAILNTLLKILNERQFNNGSTLIHCPLRMCVGASNEWPTGEGSKELGALFDRFLFRKEVRAINSDKGLDALLWNDIEFSFTTSITPSELDHVSDCVKAMTWDTTAKESMVEIIRNCRAEGVVVGDRRVRKAVKACAAYAWTQGASEVETDHLAILSDCLWVDPIEQPRKVASIVRKIANPTGLIINGLMLEVDQILSEVNPKEIKTIIRASKQLNEIKGKLKAFGDKAKTQMNEVKAAADRLRLTTLDSFDD